MPFPPDGKPPTAARLRIARLGGFRLAYAPQMARLTQVSTEVAVEYHAPLQATQLPVEVLVDPITATRVTQLAVEAATPYTATLRMTQGAVEVYVIPPPCYNGQFPVDQV